MTGRSWIELDPDDPAYALPADLRAEDGFSARDAGWVNQMRFLIRDSAPIGACVLDPFAGFGTTLLACHLEGRAGLGVEIEPVRVRLANERLRRHGASEHRVVHGSALDLPFADDSVDVVLTSLPYFRAEPRPDDPFCATADHLYQVRDYQAFMATLDRAFREFARVLRARGRAIVVCENLNLEGQFFPLAWDAGRGLARHFELRDERLFVYRRESAPNGRADRAHEYILIGEKGA